MYTLHRSVHYGCFEGISCNMKNVVPAITSVVTLWETLRRPQLHRLNLPYRIVVTHEIG